MNVSIAQNLVFGQFDPILIFMWVFMIVACLLSIFWDEIFGREISVKETLDDD